MNETSCTIFYYISNLNTKLIKSAIQFDKEIIKSIDTIRNKHYTRLLFQVYSFFVLVGIGKQQWCHRANEGASLCNRTLSDPAKSER